MVIVQWNTDEQSVFLLSKVEFVWVKTLQGLWQSAACCVTVLELKNVSCSHSYVRTAATRNDVIARDSRSHTTSEITSWFIKKHCAAGGTVSPWGSSDTGLGPPRGVGGILEFSNGLLEGEPVVGTQFLLTEW